MRAIIISLSAIAIAILAFCFKGLFIDQHLLNSTLVGKTMPDAKLPTLNNQTNIIQQIKPPYVINVFASWCSACKYEHGFWQELPQKYKNKLYGIAYKDNAKKLHSWLELLGNPYQDVLLDVDGNYSMSLGVYGTPETFIVDKNAVVVYRHVGPMNMNVWDKNFKPLLDQ